MDETLDELDRFLNRDLAEQEVEHALYGECHASYVPQADGLTTSQWVESVRDRIRLMQASRGDV